MHVLSILATLAIGAPQGLMQTNLGATGADRPPSQETSLCTPCHRRADPTIADAGLRPCPRRPGGTADEALPHDVIVLDALEDLYLPVLFDHGGHARMAEMGGGCVECHHYTDRHPRHPACRSCHAVSPARETISMPGLKGAYHRQCLACHRDWSHQNACNVCHRPKVGAPVSSEFSPATFYEPPTATPSFVYRTAQEPPIVTFHHVDHADAFGLSCADCHQNDSCARCHHGPQDTESHHGRLDRQSQCMACHAEPGGSNCGFCHKHEEQPPSFNHAVATGWSLEPNHGTVPCRVCHDHANTFRAPAPDCTGCHADGTHGSFDHRSGGGDLNCERCHTQPAHAAAATYTHPPLERGCDTCHDPLASEGPYFLRDGISSTCVTCHDEIVSCLEQAATVHGAVRREHTCTNCHDPHGASLGYLLRSPREDLCLSCHDRPVSTESGRILAAIELHLVPRAERHGPLREKDCTACHQPHAGEHARLLRAAYPAGFYAPFADATYELCFDCHDRGLVADEPARIATGFRDRDTNLHRIHLDGKRGRTCGACHDLHASSRPHHIREHFRFESNAWTIPFDYEQRPDGGRCAPACHVSRAYHRPPQRLTIRATY